MSAERRCPDDGACHHRCGEGACFRVAFCAPLSAYGDDWTEADKQRHRPELVMPSIEKAMVQSAGDDHD